MTVENFNKQLGFEILSMPAPEREITGAYVGDLLSWVMGKAEEGCVWITIMTNVNVVAVASLRDVSLVLLTENVEIEKEVVATAIDKGVNLLRTPLTTYAAAKKISGLIP